MKQKKLILIVTAIVYFSLIAVSPAQAIADPVSIAIVGFAALVSLIVGDKAIENGKDDSAAMQAVPKHKTEDKLRTTSHAME